MRSGSVLSVGAGGHARHHGRRGAGRTPAAPGALPLVVQRAARRAREEPEARGLLVPGHEERSRA